MKGIGNRVLCMVMMSVSVDLYLGTYSIARAINH